MTRLMSEEKLAAAIARKLFGTGHATIEDLRTETAQLRPGAALHVGKEELSKIIGEVDGLGEAVHVLATEVRAFRDNVLLKRDAPPARPGICASCRSFEWLKSPVANIAPVYQAFPEDVGACCRGRPTMTQRASSAGPVIVPMFLEMHPEQRCDEWSPLHAAAPPA